jgi:alpha-1,6-mannosyltransferase
LVSETCSDSGSVVRHSRVVDSAGAIYALYICNSDCFRCLFRLSLLFAPPYLSDDIFRYVWDGRVQAAGINPYRHIPADPVLADLRDDKIYPRINRRDYAATMYPPLAQFTYLLTTRISESVTWMKATMLLFEVVTIWALLHLLTSFGLPRERVLLYAWHPLIVWEVAGQRPR